VQLLILPREGSTKSEQEGLQTELAALKLKADEDYLAGDKGLIKRIEILSKTFPEFTNLIKDGKLVN
jgi:hypothetical protein